MKFEGAMTALVTPLRDGKVDLSALEALVEQQIAGGVSALVAVGTTGESATLDVPEHLEVIRECVRFAKGRVPIVAGAGANSTSEAISLSEASKSAGADALLQVAPYYNKPTQEGMYGHFRAIAESTPLPVILYNVPGRTVADLEPTTVARLSELPNVQAIKEATGDMQRISDIVGLCGDGIAILSGDDFSSLPAMSIGARGVISVVSNPAPKLMSSMCKAALDERWEEARKIHHKLHPLNCALFCESNPIPVKAAMHLLGIVGPEIRLPLTEALPETVTLLKNVLEELDLL